MALKKVVKSENKGSDKLSQLEDKVSYINQQIFSLNMEKRKLQQQILEIKIAPFKIDEVVLAEIPSGRNKKWQKCLTECGDGILFLRPYKSDGKLSGRRFSCTPEGKGVSYSDLLKKVDE